MACSLIAPLTWYPVAEVMQDEIVKAMSVNHVIVYSHDTNPVVRFIARKKYRKGMWYYSEVDQPNAVQNCLKTVELAEGL